jgi:hypothetical protein
MDDGEGVWYDFVTGGGGGVLDSIQRLNGWSKREAVHWLAALGGMNVGEGIQPRRRRSDHVRQHAEMQRDLTAARYFIESISAPRPWFPGTRLSCRKWLRFCVPPDTAPAPSIASVSSWFIWPRAMPPIPAAFPHIPQRSKHYGYVWSQSSGINHPASTFDNLNIGNRSAHNYNVTSILNTAIRPRGSDSC